MTRFPSRYPIVSAPMAGGPSTPQLTAAVSNAGGLGFLAGASLSVDALDQQLTDIERVTSMPYGVNLFVPSRRFAEPDALAAYRALLEPLAAELGVSVGEPVWSDDNIAAKIDVVCAHRPAAVSVTFGSPGPGMADRVKAMGALMIGTVTSIAEAEKAVADGADMLVVQGSEAGGHRGVFDDDITNDRGGEFLSLPSLLMSIGLSVEVPLIAAGGIMDGSGIVAALGWGAVAAQLGTAFLCSDEAGTNAVHRRALLGRQYDRTIVTRAFSGRPARGLSNEFASKFTSLCPAGYPELQSMTAPLRTAAVAAGRSDVPNLWAGTGWRAVTDGPAGDIVARLVREMETA